MPSRLPSGAATWIGESAARSRTAACPAPSSVDASVTTAAAPEGTEYTSVVSGKMQFTVNGKTYDLVPGSYVVIPAKAHHMAKCAPGAECIAITRRAGPPDYNWVK